ncbi:hypothetical protein [Tenacibaculum amylolyticum]|uniref:hypothetical protein n=1 Tax=Tenacibaculum amylolyticum TaxID=104269 RepID=UPI0038955E91
MSKIDITDKEIQQYVFDKANCKQDVIAYIESSTECLELVASYQELSKELGELPVPNIGIDIASNILEQLPVNKPKTPFITANKTALLLLGLGIVSILIHFINIPALNWKRMENKGVYFTLSIGFFIGVLWITDMVQSFQKKMTF